jgi:GT2 family glycosyltransferase
VKYDVLVVSYNTCDDTLACLSSLLATGVDPGSIHVADNGSQDETTDRVSSEYPGVHLYSFQTNRFYARAVNHLIEFSSAPYLLLLNPDVLCDMKQLTTLCTHFDDDPDLVAVAPQLRFPDGRVQASCRRLPDVATPWREIARQFTPMTSRWKMDDFDHRREADVEQPMFSCIWIRRSAITELGMLDESYPLFFNDVDWCRRVCDAGKRIRFDPSVAASHVQGGTTRLYPFRKLWHSHRSFARYLSRNSSFPRALLGLLGVWLSFLARLPFCEMSRRS